MVATVLRVSNATINIHAPRSSRIMNYATQLTRQIAEGRSNPERSMLNKKPYRTKSQKVTARDKARKDKDGTFRSNTPRSFHAS